MPAARCGDAVTVVLDRAVDIARGDMIVDASRHPHVGRRFDAMGIALSQNGIVSGRRYWLKASSRQQRVRVTVRSELDLTTNQHREAQTLSVNSIGTLHLNFEEDALFDQYDQNRVTGSFILIDPETYDTIAAGMISQVCDQSGRATENSDPEQIVVTMPAELGAQFLQLSFHDENRDRIDVQRIFGSQTIDTSQLLDEG